MKLQSVGIAGLGRYLPSTRVTNADLEKVVETTDEWIFQRTGIRERRRASDDEISSSLAVKASQQALEDAGITPEEIGLVIVATATPDQPFPATAVQVIEDLGCVNAGGWDLSAACSGFVFCVHELAVRSRDLGAWISPPAHKLACLLYFLAHQP